MEQESTRFLISVGFTRALSDPCLYTRINESEYTLLLIHVDDITIASNNKVVIAKLIESFKTKFKMDDRGELNGFLE